MVFVLEVAGVIIIVLFTIILERFYMFLYFLFFCYLRFYDNNMMAYTAMLCLLM